MPRPVLQPRSFARALVAALVVTAACSGDVVEAPPSAEISVLVTPDARIVVNGEDKGVNASLVLEGLPPGPYRVRLEADGYESVDRELNLSDGSREKVIEQLVAIASPEPAGEEGPPDAPEPEPDDAEVVVGDTPAPVEPRRAVPVATAGPPGMLSVGIAGGGWAHVYVDGNKLDKTAPLTRHEVPPGAHTIRVVNEGAGLDYTRRVDVVAGKLVKVTAKPD